MNKINDQLRNYIFGVLVLLMSVLWLLLMMEEWYYQLIPHNGEHLSRSFAPPFWIVKANTILAVLLGIVGFNIFNQVIGVKKGLLYCLIIGVIWILIPIIYYW